MTINHLIIGAKDVSQTSHFYCDLLGFKKTNDDPGAPNGQVLSNTKADLIILPMNEVNLPNPTHLAFEVKDRHKFDQLLEKANKLNLFPTSEPQKNSRPGSKEFQRGDQHYKNFYVRDPSNLILEIMIKV